MTNSGRSKSARRSKRSASQMIVAGLLALAVIASLFLIFSNSVQLLRVGLVVALWAATLGAIAMTKYRRESALDKAKVADLQTVYELQLEREISARREYELSVESRIRREVGTDSAELSALREELVALRRNLEALFEGGLLPERPALKADSTRVGELGGGSYSAYQPAASGLYVPGAGQNATNSPSPQVGGLASPNDGPVTAETTVVFEEVAWREAAAKNAAAKDAQVKRNSQQAQGAQRGENREPAVAAAKPVVVTPPIAKPVVVKPETVKPVAKPVVDEPVVEEVVEVVAEVVEEPVVAEVVEEPVVTPASSAPEPIVTPASSAPEPIVTPASSAPEPTNEPTEEPRRRRRAVPDSADSGAHSNGLTVAEIMANLSSANPAEGSGRRRRRED
ncbi:DUF6779 domain-containing protein [Rhodococcus sp. IEGM 1366]|uniref:DUF6779 domain-containing protein n=1 Tax=Rhodococcus sp. IEGM 1366 TaxID=3082223 RepID=UPI002954467C|nr:DUF6779 domain-containing protein [Rhodococcus sp. IEGM 1366]MDV8067331.1 DUF6779 domain-containing protein [Rhodococcus sp. IEGM 1366]